MAAFISIHYSPAQQIHENNYGINGGVIIAFGNKFDRIGININAYYLKNNFQLNSELRVYINFKNLGPKKQYAEAITSLGLVYGYGKSNSDTNYFYTSVSNQTQLTNSIGYSFNYYFNAIGTSQQTGIVSFQFSQINFIVENDLFAKPKLDRYRTGAFLLQYKHGNYQYGINSTLFTGHMGNKIKDENYPYSHLYKDTNGGKYTQYSHGLLSAQFQYVSPNSYQKVQGNIGIDSERIRHAIQNRLIHDMIFLPENWRKKNAAHTPMLDENGNQYLFKEGQKIKPASFYFNLYNNPGVFY
ncbi:MAG: hypothetical protein JKX68_02270 [Flavobacteriales bacterium]|nr:hypothetical protein [Flavobacteriales bacterium]